MVDVRIAVYEKNVDLVPSPRANFFRRRRKELFTRLAVDGRIVDLDPRRGFHGAVIAEAYR
jgi:hypothetical protein